MKPMMSMERTDRHGGRRRCLRRAGAPGFLEGTVVGAADRLGELGPDVAADVLGQRPPHHPAGGVVGVANRAVAAHHDLVHPAAGRARGTRLGLPYLLEGHRPDPGHHA
jgi:hypothetical protein